MALSLCVLNITTDNQEKEDLGIFIGLPRGSAREGVSVGLKSSSVQTSNMERESLLPLF